MQRVVRVLILLGLIVGLLAVPGLASAQGGPSGTYATGIACLNLSTTNTATIQIVFYGADGTQAATISNNSVAPNTPWLLLTPNISQLPANFTGSAVVSANEPVACSVNTQTAGAETRRVGTSNGLGPDETGPTVYATQVTNAFFGFSTYVAIQNAATAAADVNYRVLNPAGTQVFSDTVNIPANSTHVFYQDDGSLAAGFNGSAVFSAVDGTTPLAGTVALYNAGTTTTDAQFLSFNTFTSGASKLFLPRLAKNLSGVGYTSGFSCQNLGPGAANVSVAVTMLNQENSQTVSTTLTQNIATVGGAWAVYLGNAINAELDAINRGFGSATVTSTGGQVACTVNEDNRTNYPGQGSTYGGIPDGQQSATMFFPQIVALGDNSFRGGFQIANTTDQATTCTYSYSNGNVVNGVALAANGSNSVFAQNSLTSDQTTFNGSATVTCGQPIVGIYNLTIRNDANPAVHAGDPFATNNGINQ
jgi:hypothetical protein